MEPSKGQRSVETRKQILRRVLLEKADPSALEGEFGLPPGAIGTWIEELLAQLDVGPKGRAGVDAPEKPLPGEPDEAPDFSPASPIDYRAVFDHFPCGLLIENAEGRILDANEAVCQALGYGRDEILGMDVRRIASAPEAAVDSNIAKILSENRLAQETQSIRKDGTVVDMDLLETRVPLPDGGQGILVVTRDVSETRRALEALRRSEDLLRRKAQIDDIAAALSAEFLCHPTPRIDESIGWALQRIGELSSSDRSYVFLFDDSLSTMDNTHEWCAEGIEPEIENLKAIPCAQFPWWMEHLRRFKSIDIPRVADLPPEASAEKQILEIQDIQSLMIVPLRYGDTLIGFLGFDSVRQEKEWTEDEIGLLQRVAHIFAGAIQRNRMEAALQASRAGFRNIVQRSADGVLVTGTEGVILFANAASQRLFGRSADDLVGDKFNQEFAAGGLSEIDVYLDTGEIGVAEVCAVETEWEGRKAHLLTIRDVSERKRAEAELAEGNRRLASIAEVTATVVGSTSLSTLALGLAEHARAVFEVDACVIRVLEGERLVPLAGAGILDGALCLELPAGLGLAGLVMGKRRAISVSDVALHPIAAPAASEVSDQIRFISFAGAPLLVEDRVVGFLGIYTTTQRRDFSEADLEHLQIVANNIAVAIENDRSYATIRSQKENLENQIAMRRQAESQVRLLAHGLESISEMVSITDLQNRFTYVNKAFLERYGYRMEEVLGQKPAFLAAKEVSAEVLKELFAATRRGGWKGELMNRAKDGRKFPIQLSTSLIRDENEEVIGLVGIAEDITERERARRQILRSRESLRRGNQKLREMRARHTAVLRSTPHGLCMIDSDWVITYANFALTRLLQEKEENTDHFVGARFQTFFKEPAEFKEFQAWVESILPRRGIASRDIQLRRENGTLVWCDISVVRFDPSKAHSGYVATITDTTERKRAQDLILEQLTRMMALRTINMAITESLDLRVTLNILLDEVLGHLDVDAAAVLLLDPYANDFEYAASRGFRTFDPVGTRLSWGEGPAGRAATERRLVRVYDLLGNSAATSGIPYSQEEGFLACFAVPLVAKSQIVGALELFRRRAAESDPSWFDFLESLTLQAAIAIENAMLFENLQHSNLEINIAYNQTLEGLSRALEHRDYETEGHSKRVTELTVRLATALSVPRDELVHIQRGALLHDLGKIGIPDRILLKPGPLNGEEWEVMKRHPLLAHEILHSISYLHPALAIPLHHHERWDGSGYPQGLKGDLIPLPARIFAVVDVWDALISDRPYRKAWSSEEALAYIREQAGAQFDPVVVEKFFEILDEDPFAPPTL